MGQKGDRAAKEPQAMRMYVDGQNLTDISALLDISDTTLRRWKSESLVPGETLDGWDKQRSQKRGSRQRLRDLFERQLAYLEGLKPDEVSPPMMDTLSKLGALVERWEKVEKAQAVASEVVKEVKRGGLSDDAAEVIRMQILGMAG